MTTIAPITHIEIVDEGSRQYARIARRGFKIKVLAAMIVHANTPIDYVAEHYDLTLAEIHARLAYYYDHQEQIDREIEDSQRLLEELGTPAKEALEQMRQRLNEKNK